MAGLSRRRGHMALSEELSPATRLAAERATSAGLAESGATSATLSPTQRETVGEALGLRRRGATRSVALDRLTAVGFDEQVANIIVDHFDMSTAFVQRACAPDISAKAAADLAAIEHRFSRHRLEPAQPEPDQPARTNLAPGYS